MCARSTDSMTHFIRAYQLQYRNNVCAGARLAARGHTHVVMLETDMVPLRPGWMNMLHNVSTKAEDFVWVCPQRHAMLLLRAPGQLRPCLPDGSHHANLAPVAGVQSPGLRGYSEQYSDFLTVIFVYGLPNGGNQGTVPPLRPRD